jgi:hypothetical protein
VHLDRFHLQAGGPAARAAGWFWVAVYVSVPLVMVVLLAAQQRAAGLSPERARPLPRWLAVALAAEGAVLLAVGVVLFVRPGAITGWPWALSPLTSRAIGAWLVSFGLAAGLAVAENDLPRLRAPAVAYLVFGVAELAALVRYAGSLAWGSAAVRTYLAFLLLVTATAAAGVRLTSRSHP